MRANHSTNYFIIPHALNATSKRGNTFKAHDRRTDNKVIPCAGIVLPDNPFDKAGDESIS